MKPYFIPLLLLALTSSMSGRTWTSSDGKTLEADFVSTDGNSVTLKRARDGKDFTIPLDRLSEEDQVFVREEAEKPQAPTAISGEYADLVAGEWKLVEHKDLPYAFYGAKDLDGAEKYPLVVVLHGKSSNNENGKQTGLARTFINPENYAKHPCLVLSPLCYQPYGGSGSGWSDNPGELTLELIKDLVKKFEIVDADRIYVIGSSMGGFGTWHFLKEESRMFAAGIPICGYGFDVGKLRSMPIWAFHGDKDDIVDVEGSRRCADELKRSKVFKYTEFAGAGHNINGKVLNDPKVHEWLFAQRR